MIIKDWRVVKLPVYKYRTKKGVAFYVKAYTGKRQVIKRGFQTKIDAMIYEAHLIKKSIHKSKATDPSCSELDSLFVDYLKHKYKSTSAYRYLTLYRNKILPFFSGYKVSRIDNTIIDMYSKHINNLKLKSISNIIYLAKEYLKFLRTYGLSPEVNESLLFVYKKPYIEKKDFDYYTLDEFKRFIAKENDTMFKLIFLLLFDYGLRIGELRGLKHRDFDLKREKVFIKRCITNKTLNGGQVVTSVKTSTSLRDYPLLDPIKEAYNDFIQDKSIQVKGDEFVFSSNRKGKVIGETSIKREQVRICNLINLRVIKLHEFRHSCATYLFNKGVEIEVVSSWLGHSDMMTTLRVYAHLLPNRKDRLKNLF